MIVNSGNNCDIGSQISSVSTDFAPEGYCINLIAPNGGESWFRNIPRRVRWSSDNLSGDVKIEISRDGGQSFETLIAATPNDGEEIITFKSLSAKPARLRISSLLNPSVTDTSGGYFSIK